jgi:hypothetical protein
MVKITNQYWELRISGAIFLKFGIISKSFPNERRRVPHPICAVYSRLMFRSTTGTSL